MRTAALLVVLAGCSFPTKPGPPFSCAGEGLPMRAQDPLHIRGSVVDPVPTDHPLPGASVTGFVIGTASPVRSITATTDSSGSFAESMTTNGVANLQFIQSHIDGYLDTFAYSPLPVASDIYVALQQFTGDEIGGIAVAVGLPPPLTTPLIVAVVDCNDEAVPGATVNVTQDQNSMVQVIYFNGDLPDPTHHETDSHTGAALVVGLNPGPVHVSATLGTIRYFAHDVTATSGAMTITEVSPY